MVTARIAGLSPGTSPPPVRIPIRPFLVLMRPPLPFCSSLQKETRRKRLRVQEPSRQRTRVDRSTIYHKPLMMHEEFAVEAGGVPAGKWQRGGGGRRAHGGEAPVAVLSAAFCSSPPRLPKACSPRRVASGGRMELMG